ncbi:MAG TPA: helix-turn-helix domain-containing protein [Actinomycetota bacterium]|jgi:DNA-binding transcriptional ArsR family regulator|nr:helix-turn-helix domain-containing protein [Actinomycetota bacterium]
MTTRRVGVVDDPEQVAVLAHPIRVVILNELRTPKSASAVARAIGESRQKTHYHVKALLEAGLIRPVEERRTGGFIEQLYEAVASSFLVSPRMAWSGDGRVRALRSQLPLEHLVRLGEALQREATELLDRAAFDGDEIPCAAIDATVRFKDEASRSAFIKEYMTALKPLLKKHGARGGSTYRVAVAVYPIDGED